MTVNAEAAFTPEEVLTSVRTGSAEIGVLGSAEPTVAADLDVVSLERQALVLISGPDDDGSERGSPCRARTFRMPADRVSARIADARSRRRRPCQWHRSQHRRRNRPPHIDSADGPQRTGPRRDARVVDGDRPAVPELGCRPSLPSPTSTWRPSAGEHHLTTPATALMAEARAYAARVKRAGSRSPR